MASATKNNNILSVVFCLFLLYAVISDAVFVLAQDLDIDLTAEERAWINQNHTVRVRFGNLPPYSIVKEGSDPEGISIDYLKLIANRAGIKIDFHSSGQTFSEALIGLEERQGPDLITSMKRTAERQEFVIFTIDY